MSQETLSGMALQGLTSGEAAARLTQYGPNAVAEERPHPWLVLLRKFWAPVPWMLEAAIALQLALGKFDEAAIITALLLFNSVLSFLQESRANNALALLKSRLELCTDLDATFENCIASTSVLKEVFCFLSSLLSRGSAEVNAISSYKEPTVDA